MPGLFEIRCISCGYSAGGQESITVVIMADGSEKTCGHPLEKSDAEEFTALSEGQVESVTDIRYFAGIVVHWAITAPTGYSSGHTS